MLRVYVTMMAVASAMAGAVANFKAEEELFESSIAHLSEPEKVIKRAEREAMLEKQRIAEDVERRHQERCEAIRSTGFWSIFR